jgi:predicted secreted protein
MTASARLAAALVFLCLPALAASGPGLTVTERDNGREYTVHPGERFTLNLRDPGDGGYSFLTPAYDGAVLNMVGEHRTAPSEPRRMGDFGRMVYEFEAVKAGQTVLTVPIKRPWEKNSETFLKITILVRP